MLSNVSKIHTISLEFENSICLLGDTCDNFRAMILVHCRTTKQKLFQCFQTIYSLMIQQTTNYFKQQEIGDFFFTSNLNLNKSGLHPGVLIFTFFSRHWDIMIASFAANTVQKYAITFNFCFQENLIWMLRSSTLS